MHIEVLVEDSSGAKLIEILLPAVIGAYAEPHTGAYISTKALAGCRLA